MMITQGKKRLTYFKGQNPEIKLQHDCFGHISNVKSIQSSKFVDVINLNSYSTCSESKSDNNIDFDIYESALINKIIIMDKETELYTTYVKNKYNKIVKSKKMILITQRLQEIYGNL